jgi:hypothetical protein
MAPSSVVQTGVKSLGWEKRTAQLLPILVELDGAVGGVGFKVGCFVVDSK